MLANREDSCQSDPQNSPSQFQEHINQGFKNDEFQSGKDSKRKNCWPRLSALQCTLLVERLPKV